MNEPMAERYCSPASDAYSEGIVAGCLDNPCIPKEGVTAHRLMEHRKLEIRKVIGREILDSRGNPTVGGTGAAWLMEQLDTEWCQVELNRRI